ncbi:MAG: hypothetical protein KOO63_14175 [Bacteroidales bacterium]|nr:hypothetical protein [Candidatus Latescibacterota bacterium]
MEIIVFTGHMIDRPDRTISRFPPERESAAREAIRKTVAGIRDESEGELVGYAGGACGGDILFHEVCKELGISTRLFLTLPPDKYNEASVQHAGTDWSRRFRKLCDEHATKGDMVIMSQEKELPGRLMEKKDYSIWERSNLWLLLNGLDDAAGDVTFLALWDGEEEGDGPGGTSHMVKIAEERGARSVVIRTGEIFD